MHPFKSALAALAGLAAVCASAAAADLAPVTHLVACPRNNQYLLDTGKMSGVDWWLEDNVSPVQFRAKGITYRAGVRSWEPIPPDQLAWMLPILDELRQAALARREADIQVREGRVERISVMWDRPCAKKARH